MKDESHRIRHASRAAWIIAIIVISTAVAMTVSWRAPGLDFYARDRLMRARGPIAAPDDIVIVAIDEASIARFGRFPWSRGLAAQALDVISAAQPKAIALDVLYSEPTTSADDQKLVDSVKRSGNAVVAAQLVETTDETGARAVNWLRPLPAIESAAAGVGHVNISTEADAEARELSLRKADDEGQVLWSIVVETIRVGEGVRAFSVRDVPGGVRLGTHIIPVEPDNSSAPVKAQSSNSRADILRANRFVIDYVGPTGSFSHQTYSFSEVADGRVPPQSFRGKYVLIGATAATLGDHLASPFVHTEGAEGEQHGELMPGVEVLANSMNTILRARFYRETPDWLAALCAALIAAFVLGSLALAQGRFEALKQLGVFGGLLALILFAAYITFEHWLIVPPVVPALISFATAAPLALLRRSLRTSSDLDARIAELKSADEGLSLTSLEPGAANNLYDNPATFIARLAGVEAVAIFAPGSGAGGTYHLISRHGSISLRSLNDKDLEHALSPAQITPHSSIRDDEFQETRESPGSRFSDVEADVHDGLRTRPLMCRLGNAQEPAGVLVIGCSPAQKLRTETLRLCAEIAANYIAEFDNYETEDEHSSLLAAPWRHLPHGVEWKTRALGVLNRRLLARTRFVDRALRSVEDGLIVADITGRISFANPRAADILSVPERALVGSNLFQRLMQIEGCKDVEDERQIGRITRETLMRLIIERVLVEREITVSDVPPRYYMLRLSAVSSGDDGAGHVLGLVAALSDVTKQRELQQVKTDVMTLVTHELRTPLTAIQGMSEVLAQFDVDAGRRREMHLAINDEAKRLSRMINEYLDVTKLESGARPLHLAPVRLAPLVERGLLLLDPLAAQRDIRIVRKLSPNLPALLADADLIAQAITNLVANAIKYSPVKTSVVVEVSADSDALLIEVADQGYGIPADSLSRIFEKFYRVPRVEDVDMQGTGLGLTLVREIVELHGGRVTVESEMGVGSTFSVRLPLSPAER